MDSHSVVVEPSAWTRLPAQRRSIARQLSLGHGGRADAGAPGVQAAQTACDGLTGLAQQMCYSVLYGV
jgi:hypothetical protein